MHLFSSVHLKWVLAGCARRWECKLTCRSHIFHRIQIRIMTSTIKKQKLSIPQNTWKYINHVNINYSSPVASSVCRNQHRCSSDDFDSVTDCIYNSVGWFPIEYIMHRIGSSLMVSLNLESKYGGKCRLKMLFTLWLELELETVYLTKYMKQCKKYTATQRLCTKPGDSYWSTCVPLS